jgi:hypothetical protein
MAVGAGTVRAECEVDAGRGPDTGTGCMAVGQGPTVVEACCQYEAVSGSQNVFATTREGFSVYVVRQCPSFPRTCTPVLEDDQCTPAPENSCEPRRDASGNLLLEPKTIYLMEEPSGNEVLLEPYRGKVHPQPGEVVTVFLGSGAAGYVSVGQDEALVPGGLPLP